MLDEPLSSSRLIRLSEVRLRTGLGRSSIYRKMDEGTFPRSRQLSDRAVAWLMSDIDHWIDTRKST